MQFVCGENRVEHAVVITKNGAQASDRAWGWGSPSRVPRDDTPERRFSGMRNPVFAADELQRAKGHTR
jgi:hypothetical protein